MAGYPEFPRYCGKCGEIFDGRTDVCPECEAPWPRSLPDDRLSCYAVLLTEIQELHRRGEIGTPALNMLRRIYERRLMGIRPARKPRPAPVPPPVLPRPATMHAAPAAASLPPPIGATPFARGQGAPFSAISRPAAPPRVPVPPRPPAPPRGPSFDLRQWAARRQADLVLYLGAFLLTISALIFVSYQGSGLSGIAKCGLFAVYTLLFLGLGTQLRKWERVQEAGPVFVALGAILTPLNFVALYTEVLQQEDVAQPWVWFAGSSLTSGLYFFLAKSGFGRFYMVPGALAALAAYASLGAVLELPAEWYGPWFLALAVITNVVAHQQPARLRKWVEGGAYIFAVPGLAFSQLAMLGESVDSSVLPVAYLLASAVLVRSAFPSRRAVFVGLLPPFAAMTVAATAWAIPGSRDAAIDWAPVWILAAGAGYIALRRARADLAEGWCAVSFVFAAAGVGLAHLLVAEGELTSRLPVAYLMALGIATGWALDRRYPAAIGLIPPLSAATAESALWSAGWLSFEWTSTFIAAVGFGFIGLGWAMPKLRETWYGLAGVAGAGALTAAHIGATYPDLSAWQLPIAYGMVTAGAAAAWVIDRRYSIAIGLVPALAAATAESTAWAADWLSFEWTSSFIAAAGLGYVALGWRLPTLRETWYSLAGAAGVFALAAAHIGATYPELNGWQLPLTYAMVTAGAAAAWFIDRRYDVAIGLVPALTAATAETTAWAADWLSFEWTSSFIAAAGLGYVALGWTLPKLRQTWYALAGAAGVLGLAAAHLGAADPELNAWQLPVAYAMVAAGGAFAAFHIRPAALVSVFASAAGGAATLWALDVTPAAWAFPALGVGALIVATESLWRRDKALSELAWPPVVALALTPIAVLAVLFDEQMLGAVNFAAGSALFYALALRTNGAFARLFGTTAPNRERMERQVFALAGSWMFFAAAGFFNAAIGLDRVESAWTFAAAGAACWLAVAGSRRYVQGLEEVLGPVGLTAAIIGVLAASGHSDHVALMLAVLTGSAALAVGGRWAQGWRGGYFLAGGLSLLFAHDYAGEVVRDAWQLPLAYAVVLAALVWDSAWNRFEPVMLVVPGAAVAFATSLGWWRDIPTEHFAWAPLGIAAAIAAGERLWLQGRVVRLGGWPWVLALSLAPLGLLNIYDEAAWSGVAAIGISAALWAAAAWRSNGLLSELLGNKTPKAASGERRLLALAAYGLGLGTLAQFNYAAGVALDMAAWTFVGVGAVALAGSAVKEPRWAGWDVPFLLAGVAAFSIALATVPTAGEAAAMVGIAGTVLIIAGLTKRYDLRLLTGAGLGAVAVGLVWVEAEWQAWTLALTYAAVAVALFGGLANLRKTPRAMKAAVGVLSSVPVAVALLTAAGALAAEGATTDEAGAKLVTTPEWLTLAATIAVAGGMMVFEGAYRLGRRWIVAGSAALLVALELTIASFEPSNVQAYTVPLALYLIGWALATRESSELFGRHMCAHEFLFVLGAGFLVGPPAIQSFDPGGSNWALLVIAEGIALLGVGLTLLQRWLVVSGVVTLVGVAGRFIWEGTASGAIPYWVSLGFVGLVLLGIGVLMLLERDWWDRTRTRVAHWWMEGPDHGSHGLGTAAG